MKIALVVQRFPYGGAERYVEQIASRLHMVGEDVTVISSKAEDVDDKIYSFPIIRLSKLFSVGEYSVWRGLGQVLKKKDFDLVHTNTYGYFHSDYLAHKKEKFRYKLVLTSHGFTGMEVHSLRKNKIITGPNMLNSIRPIYDRKIGQKTILKCDHLIALSKKDEELYLQMGIGKSKITIIPPGIMESFFVKPEEDQVRKVKIALEADPALLSVGELSWIKSHAVMIKALNIIVKERPHAKLFIIGRNRTELGNLKNLSEKLGLVKNVYFLGFKNENEVKTYMHCSDLFLHTSLAEGLSTALLESMACGLPYITTPAGGNGYLAQESNAGVVVPFEDEAALANAVLSLTNDKKTHEKLSSNGCTYAQNLRWDKVFSRIVQIYNDLSNNDKS